MLSTFFACAIGFFVVGWLASVDSTAGLSWQDFDPVLGFAFAASFAQLVLAAVVWAQIRTANDAVQQARNAAATAAEQVRNQRAADSIATFVGHASNASNTFGTAVVMRLRAVTNNPGDIDLIEAARDQIAEANRARNAAHAERFHIRVRTTDGPEVDAAKRFLELLDRQSKRSGEVIAWSNLFRHPATTPPPGSPPPNPLNIYEDTEPLRSECLDLAAALLG